MAFLLLNAHLRREVAQMYWKFAPVGLGVSSGQKKKQCRQFLPSFPNRFVFRCGRDEGFLLTLSAECCKDLLTILSTCLAIHLLANRPKRAFGFSH